MHARVAKRDRELASALDAKKCCEFEYKVSRRGGDGRGCVEVFALK